MRCPDVLRSSRWKKKSRPATWCPAISIKEVVKEVVQLPHPERHDECIAWTQPAVRGGLSSICVVRHEAGHALASQHASPHH